jgi:hypothetical protein
MTEQGSREYPIEEALRAQKALRDKAGLPTELFPVGAFVGMISNEIESLLSAATPIRRLRTPSVRTRRPRSARLRLPSITPGPNSGIRSNTIRGQNSGGVQETDRSRHPLPACA